MVDYVSLIQKKKDGGEHSTAELEALVGGYLAGDVADYQMSAWLMAVVLRGLTFAETLALTDIQVDSGIRLDLEPLGRIVVDKHSTGGVGDKVTLVLAPLVAACGAVFGKMSGRGLGHTGGTIDKLEAIPGFRTAVDPDAFIEQLRRIGVCVAGQSDDLVPADRKLYALRGVTATVESNPLIAASIMSKKIAAGASAVVIDLKIGRGAFFRNRGQASGAFHLMREIGAARGLRVQGLASPMDEPLGNAVGNSLEVIEAVETLRGRGPRDLVEVVTRLGAMALAAADAGFSVDQAREEVGRRLGDGTALERFRQLVTAQGGDPGFIEDPAVLPAARHVLPVTSATTGYVSSVNALEVGRAMLPLGAGRLQKEDAIDHGAGLVIHAKSGAVVTAGDLVAEIHANDFATGEAAVAVVAAAYSYSDEEPRPEWRITEL